VLKASIDWLDDYPWNVKASTNWASVVLALVLNLENVAQPLALVPACCSKACDLVLVGSACRA